MPTDTVLIVDADASVRQALCRSVAAAGREMYQADSVLPALDVVREASPDLVVAEVDLPGADGFALLDVLKAEERGLDVDVILMAHRPDPALVLRARSGGALDLLPKPVDLERMHGVVSTALDARRAPAADVNPDRPPTLVGNSAQIADIRRQVARCAPTDAPVLIAGPTGTGKEVIARCVHENSLRGDGPFVAVNLGGLPEALAESDLFGYVKGAFTDAKKDRKGCFARAKGGTLFLDEIGEASPGVQVKILRVLQDGIYIPLGGELEEEADARVVAATNRDLAEMVERGEFRRDLFFRLRVVEIRAPALAERLADDLDELLPHLMAEVAQRYGLQPAAGLTDSARKRLLEHPWTGNVRELENALASAMIQVAGGVIRSEHLDLAVAVGDDRVTEAARRANAAVPEGPPRVASGLRFTTPEGRFLTAAEVEEAHVRDALRLAEGNITAAAKHLALSRQKVQRRMENLGIERPERAG